MAIKFDVILGELREEDGGGGAVPSLSAVLASGNATGGNDICIDEGDALQFKNSGFTTTFGTTTLTGDHTIVLPNASGTVALLTDAGIYGNSKSLTVNHTATFGALDLTFLIDDPTNGRFKIGQSGAAASAIHFEAPDSSGILVEGFDTTDNVAAFTVYNQALAIQALRVENNGDVAMCLNGVAGQARTRLSVGVLDPISNSLVTIQGYDTTTGVPSLYVANSTGSLGMILEAQNDRRVGIRAMGTTSTVFNVRGIGTSSANIIANFEDSIGVDRYQVWDNGQSFMGAAVGITTSPTFFGHWWRAANFSISGFAMYVSNTPNVLSIQLLGTTATGIIVGVQGSPAGISKGIDSTASATTPTTNYGVHGLARNGTSLSVGVFGEITGGGTVLSSSFKAGVWGDAHSAIDQALQYGVYGRARQNAVGTVYSGTMIGVIGEAIGSANAGSTVTAIGVDALVRSNIGNSENIALRVPATNNVGTVLFGADARTTTQALLELVATDKAFLIMRMTGAQASAGITAPVNGMGIYITAVDATFTSTGFWKYENGAWATW